MSHNSDTEIAEDYFVVVVQQHVLWLHVAVNQFLVVGILQGFCCLIDIGNDGGEWEARSMWMFFAQGAIGSVVHHEVGNIVFDAKVEQAHDVGMDEPYKGASFIDE